MTERHSEFLAGETRRIGSFPWNRLETESAGRGWRSVHASVATVNPWAGEFGTGRHPCIAYCVSRPAFLSRRLEGRGSEQVTLRPRQFFLIPAHCHSEWERRGQTEMLMIYLRQDLLDRLADESGSLARNGRPVEFDLPPGTADPFLEQFALEVLDTLRAPDDGTSAFYIDALAHAAAVHVLRRHVAAADRDRRDDARKKRSAPCPGLDRARALIEAELTGNLSLVALAREAGLPLGAFGRSFREAFGTSPHQYVLARRLSHARMLLISTDLPIEAIALDAGFSSQSHFTTAFKRQNGIAPAAFRRAA